MLPKFLDQSKLVHKPGVYMFFDGSKSLLYVGKAIDLNKRVGPYFSGQSTLKTSVLVSKIASVDTIVVESELEALILEANLIKKYLPPFNIRLTDDKDYLYIKITNEDFPKIVTARKTDLEDSRDYYGPFPSSTVVKSTLKTLRRIFPWCSGKRLAVSTQRSACFYYHLGLCPGACVGQISKEEYRKIISRFVKFMDGKKSDLVEDLSKEMDLYAKNLEFEQAARLKKIIQGMNYVTQPNRVSLYLENPNFLEDQRVEALDELKQVLNLIQPPQRIECYDISNIQGKNATGSMVVLTNGEIDKSQYRKFKIKLAGKPNDYAMHAEMMSRRLKHQDWPLPDLFLIDGGRGQVRAVQDQLRIHNVILPIFGIAKRMEWLYPPDGEVVKLPKRSLALRLLQRIRDEAHRFAITYHRKLRKNAFVQLP